MNGDFTHGMGFLPPLPVSLSNMTTNVAASTLLAWVAGKTYALNDEIIDADRVIWRSMADANTGNNPASSDGKWQRRGVENRLRMFDASLGSFTEADDMIEVVIKPGRVVTDVMLLGVQAHDVQVSMVDPVDGEVFDSGQRLMLRPSGNSHWGYFFNPIERQRKLHISGLTAYTQASITIRIRNQGAKARCAEVVLGRAVWLGNTQWRPSIGFDDWSLKKRDDWGGWMAEPGAYSDRLKLQVLVQGTQYERVRNEILAYRARPVVWIGARGYGVLTTYGYITGFDQVLVAHGFSDCNLTIEGLEDDELHPPA
ncbi:MULTISPECIES: hypothetical protein [Delftia]|uniref:Uncharacterized protein n=2 Tax=Delftia TaxID=80865 RepID=A0A7T2VWG5_DELAC|nr:MULTISPECIES: hypothetical protein [Delftia]MBB1651311.1 hypothetical protein [Delftia sp. UME58]QPS05861.1 hypothetical protein I6G66_16160 [Delftia acidovorans]